MKFANLLKLSPLFILAVGCVTHVDAGHVGVEINSCSGGGVNLAPLGVGYHSTGPCVSIVEYPVYQQTLVLTKNPHEGQPHDESITVTSSEGLPISVDVGLSFTLDPSKVPAMYGKFRQEIEVIEATYMRQAIRESLQETFAKFTAQQLYSDKREEARAEVQKLLADKLKTDGFLVSQFTLNETRVPVEVEQAIKNKVAMIQEAQRAEQEVKKTEALARQKVAAAEGEAQAKRLAADAEAYANQKVASSISATLVEYLKVQKWNGVMPTVTGGSSTIMQLPTPHKTE